MIVVVGESGSGKTTLVNNFINKHPEWSRIVTYTTRPMRETEIDGIDYYFVSPDEFNEMVNHNRFIENAEYRGWHYGTPLKDCLQKKKIIILTPSGLRTLKRLGVKNIISVYLKVDRASRLINLIKRGDNIDEAYRRNLSDAGMFDDVEMEVDFTINNEKYILNSNEILTRFEKVVMTE